MPSTATPTNNSEVPPSCMAQEAGAVSTVHRGLTRAPPPGPPGRDRDGTGKSGLRQERVMRECSHGNLSISPSHRSEMAQEETQEPAPCVARHKHRATSPLRMPGSGDGRGSRSSLPPYVSSASFSTARSVPRGPAGGRSPLGPAQRGARSTLSVASLLRASRKSQASPSGKLPRGFAWFRRESRRATGWGCQRCLRPGTRHRPGR